MLVSTGSSAKSYAGNSDSTLGESKLWFFKYSYASTQSYSAGLNVINNDGGPNFSVCASSLFLWLNQYCGVFGILLKILERFRLIDSSLLLNICSSFDDEEDTSNKFHYINFEIPIFLKDISEFFKQVSVLKFAEFNIGLKFIDDMIISSRENIETTIKSCHLFVKEVELFEDDYIKYLKMLNDGYSKTINFLECHTRIFNDKMSEVNENFYVNNVQNCDSVYMYGILNTNKEGLKYDLPSVKFEKPYLNIDNIKFENPIENDISAYDELKSKSNHYDNFLLTYPNLKNYYRIYCFNVSRNIRDDHNNKFINITTNMETTSCVVYIVLKTHSSVKLNYSKNNGLVVYKSQ